MIPVLVMTSDKYIDAIKPFVYLFNRYWRPVSIYERPDIIICGFTEPPWIKDLAPNVRFESLGEFDRFPIGRWSDALKIALERIKDEHVIVMLEDYWLTHPVNVVAVDHALKYVQSHPFVIKFDLMADRFYAKDADLNYGTYGILELIKSSPESPYHLSLMTGIWNRTHLLDILHPKWSPWDIEIKGTTVLSQMPEYIVVGSYQWPVHHTLAFRGGDISKIYLNELQLQDQYKLEELGYLEKWNS